MIDRRWLFICSCIALVTSAFTFIVRGDVLQALGDSFFLTQAQKGSIEGAVFFGMALSMLGGGFICDALGMRRIMFLAFASHLVGSLGTIFAANIVGVLPESVGASKDLAYYWLWLASLLMGFGNGFTEVAINPLVATLFPREKTHYLNVLHAWWPGGLVLGGLATKLLVQGFVPNGVLGFSLWQTTMWLIAIPAIVYGVMLIPAKFPQTERVESGVSTGDMFKECLRPMFLLWAICMLMTAATELGPQKWQESVMRSTAGISGTWILVYTSGMMFVLRHFAGPIAHRISPVGMMLGSSILAGLGLFLLSTADNAIAAFSYATIFGLGIAYFWPTMLGVTAERFPKGGALALALMGSVGNLSISQVLPQMGAIVDRYSTAELTQVDGYLRKVVADPQTPKQPDLNIPKKLAGVQMSPAEWAWAYNDPLMTANDARATLLKLDAQIKQLIEITADGVKPSETAVIEVHPELLAFRKSLMEAYADTAWLDAAKNSTGQDFPLPPPPGDAAPLPEQVRYSILEACKTLGQARAFNAVGGVVQGGALSADAIRGLESDVITAIKDIHAANPKLLDTIITKDDVRASLGTIGKLEGKERGEAEAALREAIFTKGTLNIEEINALALKEPDLVEPLKTRLAKVNVVLGAQAVGFSMAFRWVSMLPLILIVIFGGIFLYDRSRGGYKPELLLSREEENELMSGGVEGPVE